MEGAQRGQAREDFEELCVDGGLGLEVEEAELAGGAEVAALEEVVEEEEGGKGGGDVRG